MYSASSLHNSPHSNIILHLSLVWKIRRTRVRVILQDCIQLAIGMWESNVLLTSQLRFLVLSHASTVMVDGNGLSRHPTAVLEYTKHSL